MLVLQSGGSAELDALRTVAPRAHALPAELAGCREQLARTYRARRVPWLVVLELPSCALRCSDGGRLLDADAAGARLPWSEQLAKHSRVCSHYLLQCPTEGCGALKLRGQM